jgi:transcription factor AP-1
METTMYDDMAMARSGSNHHHGSLKDLKRSMTLDFNSACSLKAKKAKLGTPSGLLGSPDLNMLKLASPELERMIIQQNGMVTTTPTPTQFLCPKFVTEEQEAYARGFVDALEELHKKEDPLIQTVTTSDGNTQTLALLQNSNSHTYAQVQPQSQQQAHYQNIMSSTATSMNNANTMPQQSYSHTIPTQVNNNVMLPHVKEEPQTVPSISNSPPLSPINMESQERIKLERKRARNRIAARKCRHRKLERISRLEDKIDGLKDQNTSLSDTATQLRDQVCRLKQQILQHVKSGCQVMMSQNLTF